MKGLSITCFLSPAYSDFSPFFRGDSRMPGKVVTIVHRAAPRLDEQGGGKEDFIAEDFSAREEADRWPGRNRVLRQRRARACGTFADRDLLRQ